MFAWHIVKADLKDNTLNFEHVEFEMRMGHIGDDTQHVMRNIIMKFREKTVI